jgi:hypothetical protein
VERRHGRLLKYNAKPTSTNGSRTILANLTVTSDLICVHAQASIGSGRRPGRLVLPLIVAVGIARRLIHITQPFVDQWSWRQSDVAMIARHFSEDDFRV